MAIDFIPIVGKRACFHDEEHDHYGDVKVHKIYRRGRYAEVSYVKEKERFEVAIDSLTLPLEADVNERFGYFFELAKMVLTGKSKSLFVSGPGGLGKSYTLDQVVQYLGFTEDNEYIKIKGHTAAFALYKELEQHKDKVIVFDDCDDAFKDSTSANILKAILDSYPRRRVSWLSKANSGSTYFDFTGSCIFLSNIPKDKVADSILSRSLIIDLYMTPKEVIERMEHILPTTQFGTTLTIDEKIEVLKVLDKYKFTLTNLNIRTLEKALEVFENTRDMGLVRYQILNS